MSDRARTTLAMVLIVVGAILAPVAVVTHWAADMLTDTDRVASALAPLAHDPDVQQVLVTRTVGTVEDRVNLDALTAQAGSALRDLGLSDRTVAALGGLVSVPLSDALHSLLTRLATSVVTSDQFASTWDATIRLTHAQLVATVSGSASAVVSAGDTGEISLELAPIAAAVRQSLSERDSWLAGLIGTPDTSIVIARFDHVDTVRFAYRAVVATGAWAGAVSAVLLVAGLGVATRRRTTALVGGAVVAGVAAVVAIVGWFVRRTLTDAVALPPVVTRRIVDALTAPEQHLLGAVGVAGALVALGCWLAPRVRRHGEHRTDLAEGTDAPPVT